MSSSLGCPGLPLNLPNLPLQLRKRHPLRRRERPRVRCRLLGRPGAHLNLRRLARCLLRQGLYVVVLVVVVYLDR